MFREHQVLDRSEASAIEGQAIGIPKVALNLLLVAVLVAVLGPGRQLFYADVEAREQAQAVERLVKAFDEHLARLGVVVRSTQVSGQGIQLVGPPSGTLYEPAEEITLRWTVDQVLKTGESYRVVAAYYKNFGVKVPLQPAFRYLSTTKESVQLPVLDVDSSLPIIAWTVYVVSGTNDTPTGAVSGNYRLLHIVRPDFYGSVYFQDSGF